MHSNTVIRPLVIFVLKDHEENWFRSLVARGNVSCFYMTSDIFIGPEVGTIIRRSKGFDERKKGKKKAKEEKERSKEMQREEGEVEEV